MGSGASSVSGSADGQIISVIHTHLKKLPDAIEEAVYVHEKFPIVVDASEQAARFLKYQNGPFLSLDDPIQGTKSSLNRALVASIQHGRTFTLKVPDLSCINPNIFEEGVFPKELLSRDAFFRDGVWQKVFNTKLGDPDPNDVLISPQFVFVLTTPSDNIPDELKSMMCVIKVGEKQAQRPAGELTDGDDAARDPAMSQIAELYGARDIIRYGIL